MTRYIWDVVSDNVLMETDDAGETTAVYTQEPDRYGELISQHRDGQTSYYHFDGEGNTRALTDANQNIVETATYSAFGEVVEKTSSISNPFGYKGALGYYTNAETNDIYVRARTYEPSIGRWCSVDPLGHIDGLNVYSYAAQSPLSFADPSGLLKVVLGKRAATGSENCGSFAVARDVVPEYIALSKKLKKYFRPIIFMTARHERIIGQCEGCVCSPGPTETCVFQIRERFTMDLGADTTVEDMHGVSMKAATKCEEFTHGEILVTGYVEMVDEKGLILPWLPMTYAQWSDLTFKDTKHTACGVGWSTSGHSVDTGEVPPKTPLPMQKSGWWGVLASAHFKYKIKWNCCDQTNKPDYELIDLSKS